jgi:hypothetical protein
MRIAIAVFSIVIFTIPAFAAENSSKQSSPPPSAPKSETTKTKKTKPTAQTFRGQIAALDTKAGTVSVKSDASEKTFVTQDAAKGSVERMSVGDRVKITYTEKEGKLFASSVRRIKSKNATSTKSKTTTKSSTNGTAQPNAK